MPPQPNAPVISVVVPTCDRAESLERCLTALSPGVQAIASSLYEVIVSDDSVGGETRQLVEGRFPWVRWVAGPRRGPAANRNRGAGEARGAWLAFTDDDCLPSPQWLNALRRAAHTGSAPALEGKVISEPAGSDPWDEAPLNLRGGLFWSCNAAARRDVFLAVGGFDENYRHPAMEDVDLRTSLQAAGKRIVFVPDAIVNHPPRRATFGSKLRHMQRFRSQIYFYRKWNGATPLGAFVTMVSAVTRFWLVSPLRARRGVATPILLYLLAMAALCAGFAPWYRRAGRELARRELSDGAA